MLVSKINGTFWKLNKFQKYVCNVIDHKVDNNVLQVCRYDFSLIHKATMHHPQILYKCPEFCWNFWSPWFWQWMAVGSAGFFLQYLDILSWLALGDNFWWSQELVLVKGRESVWLLLWPVHNPRWRYPLQELLTWMHNWVHNLRRGTSLEIQGINSFPQHCLAHISMDITSKQLQGLLQTITVSSSEKTVLSFVSPSPAGLRLADIPF